MSIPNKKTGGEHNMTSNHEGRITRIEVIQENILKSLDRLDARLDSLEKKMDRIDEKIDTRFDSLNTRMWNLFFWMIAGFASMFGLIAHTQHWI